MGMKRLLAAGAVIAGTLAMMPAHANTDFVATGNARVGDLLSPVTGLTPCDESFRTNGVDGRMVHLPEGSGSHRITLVGTDSSGLADFDVQFLDAGCNYIDGTALANDGNEEGNVPDGAEWAEVDLFTGVNASFTLTVYDVIPDQA
jgi:hypothetical protein